MSDMTTFYAKVAIGAFCVGFYVVLLWAYKHDKVREEIHLYATLAALLGLFSIIAECAYPAGGC